MQNEIVEGIGDSQFVRYFVAKFLFCPSQSSSNLFDLSSPQTYFLSASEIHGTLTNSRTSTIFERRITSRHLMIRKAYQLSPTQLFPMHKTLYSFAYGFFCAPDSE